MILLGIGTWMVVGLCAGLLARRLRPAHGASDHVSALWAVFGAVVGGLLAVFFYIPDVDGSWDAGPLVGAGLGGLLASLGYRVVADRNRRRGSARRRVFASVLLLCGTAVLASASWFALARANPRLYRPEVNPALDQLRMDRSLDDPGARSAFLERVVATYLMRAENAGIVIGTSVDGGRTVISGGLSSWRVGGAPVDETSVFEIGSVSKVFAGLALAEAVAAGEARLDQEVGTLLPDDPPAIGLEALPSITLAELATHSAGLPEYPAATPWWTALTSDNPWAELDERELLSSLSAAAGAIPRERSYRYSSFGFTLLSYLLERATGEAYPRLLERRLSEPLGMTRTQVPLPGSTLPGLVEGHTHGRPVPHWIGHRWAGAAGVVSTVPDLLTFAEAHWSGPGGSIAEALAMAAADHGPAAGTRRMGLGWHIRDEGDGPRILYHSGSTLGFYAYVGLAPGARVAVAVLANSSDPTAAAIGVRVLDALVATP
jgi:D-alanyl-D-alanine-carboxypeptidase/D-alanyl-D-alanine-endopeptidase